MLDQPYTPMLAAKMRLDHYLANHYPDISRSFLQKLCNTDQVLVNGRAQKSGFKMKPTDSVEVLYDMAAIEKIDDIDLPIIYQDEHIIVIDKPAGVISHSRGKFWNEPSVASFIRQKNIRKQTAKFPPAGRGDREDRAGIVHRLDRATSGVMICAKDQKTFLYLQKQFADRNVQKVYMAIVSGHLKDSEALIDLPIERNPKAPATFRVGAGGKSAQTHYKVIQATHEYSLLELRPLTGRTHQLRVHLKHIGHPIVGDTLYGGQPDERLFLHAHKLTIQPTPNSTSREFIAALPTSFNNLMRT